MKVTVSVDGIDQGKRQALMTALAEQIAADVRRRAEARARVRQPSPRLPPSGGRSGPKAGRKG